MNIVNLFEYPNIDYGVFSIEKTLERVNQNLHPGVGQYSRVWTDDNDVYLKFGITMI